MKRLHLARRSAALAQTCARARSRAGRAERGPPDNRAQGLARDLFFPGQERAPQAVPRFREDAFELQRVEKEAEAGETSSAAAPASCAGATSRTCASTASD